MKEKLTLRKFVVSCLRENEDLKHVSLTEEKIAEFNEASEWLDNREVDRDIEKLYINRILNRSLLRFRHNSGKKIFHMLVLFNPRTNTRIWCESIRDQVIPFFVNNNIKFEKVGNKLDIVENRNN